jgi:GNAT superfamily N-acetyltransferase
MIKFNKIQPEDKDYFLELNNAPETVYQMEHGRKFSEQEFKLVLLGNVNTEWYIIRDTEIKQDVGLFTVYGKNNRVYLGIIIDPNFRKQGYARKAFETYLEMTDKAGYDTWLGCFQSNKAVKLYYDLGYVKVHGHKTIRGRKFITMVRRANNE